MTSFWEPLLVPKRSVDAFILNVNILGKIKGKLYLIILYSVCLVDKVSPHFSFLMKD